MDFDENLWLFSTFLVINTVNNPNHVFMSHQLLVPHIMASIQGPHVQLTFSALPFMLSNNELLSTLSNLLSTKEHEQLRILPNTGQKCCLG